MWSHARWGGEARCGCHARWGVMLDGGGEADVDVMLDGEVRQMWRSC